MISVIKLVFKNYAVFSGRARRKEFGLFWLFCLLSGLLLSVLAMWFSSQFAEESSLQIHTDLPAFGAIYVGYGILIFLLNPASMYLFLMLLSSCVPAMVCRRLHDIGKPGKMMLLALIPGFGGIILLGFLVGDSQSGSNLYGSNPKSAEINPSAYKYRIYRNERRAERKYSFCCEKCGSNSGRLVQEIVGAAEIMLPRTKFPATMN